MVLMDTNRTHHFCSQQNDMLVFLKIEPTKFQWFMIIAFLLTSQSVG
jgi:ribosomal protein L24E